MGQCTLRASVSPVILAGKRDQTGARQLQEGLETCLGAELLGAVALGPGHSLAIRPHVIHDLSYHLGNRLGGRHDREPGDFFLYMGRDSQEEAEGPSGRTEAPLGCARFPAGHRHILVPICRTS